MLKLRNVFLFLMTISFFASCQSGAKTVEEVTEEQSKEGNTNNLVSGEKFEPTSVIDYGDLLAKMSETDSVQITVKGKVDEVCQAKGCWMTIVGGENDGMMVKFKDYGFFMPKDIAGREVIMNGKAFYSVTPVDELRHYAEDAGKSEEEIAAITEPKNEMSFLADGVILLNE